MNDTGAALSHDTTARHPLPVNMSLPDHCPLQKHLPPQTKTKTSIN